MPMRVEDFARRFAGLPAEVVTARAVAPLKFCFIMLSSSGEKRRRRACSRRDKMQSLKLGEAAKVWNMDVTWCPAGRIGPAASW